jgi:hypothetical protein
MIPDLRPGKRSIYLSPSIGLEEGRSRSLHDTFYTSLSRREENRP